MENPDSVDSLIRIFASRFRVVTLGGVAVIFHGLSRNTHDADIWIEPFESPEVWSVRVASLVFSHSMARPVRIGTWQPFTEMELSEVIDQDEVFRILGLDRPLDIFRKPNELDVTEFESVWERGTELEDGTRVPDVIDLLVTKQATGREKDMQDIAFLEAKAEREYAKKIPSASEQEARTMLERFLTPKVAEAALQNSSETIRNLGTQFLEELAADGDPFAADILRKIAAS